ncbi:hypothetical protein C8R44DRAFT_723748 [Mycena epipterygia]|nr:hypothetical protein C8R44DRAFT_723748 [Mycena epipterygia]
MQAFSRTRRSSTVTASSYNAVEDENVAPMPAHTPQDTTRGVLLQRLQKLSIASTAESRSPLSPCTLGAPFSLADAPAFQDLDKAAQNFAPRPQPALNGSPQSTTSSGSEFSFVSSSSSSSSVSQNVFEAFVATQSRVVRLFDLPLMPGVFLCSVFHPHSGLVPTLWVHRVPTEDLSVWAVFQTHREAFAALSLSSPSMSVAPALESDLEPFAKLKRFELASRVLRVSSLDPAPNANASSMEYTISSNPPNPRTSFRLGDWICRSEKCAANNIFNFGRNLTCIGCGCPRSPTANGTSAPGNDTPQSPNNLQQFSLQSPPSLRPQPSPRFASAPNVMQYPNNQSPTAYGFPPQSPHSYGRSPYASSSVVTLPPPSPLASPTAKVMSAHPLLTPSGRAFASGGKVQNISSDPLSPLTMYWPDNEPLPEQCQIRPSGLMGVPQPPILNTGNRGPISHQPGDWICLKCNYLNWRRRKVCQTCFPYAEGNGDSISAAVQAERIALLTSVLAQTRLNSPAPAPTPAPAQQAPAYPHHGHGIGRSHSTTPAQAHRPFVNFSPPPQQLRGPVVHRSQSHSELGQFAHAYPIYQTPPHQHQNQQYQRALHHPSPLQRHTLSVDASPSPSARSLEMYAPAPLLPSFLQDIVQSPTLSPSSTSSADLSFEEYDEESLPSSCARSTFSQSGADSAHSSPLANIWRLDGEESKSLSAFALPTRRELMGSAASSRNSSLERLRLHVSSS